MIKTPTIERFSDGQAIVTEGIISSKAYIVLEGEVRIAKKIGERLVTVGVLKKNDVFGEMGLFQETFRSATVTAKGNVTVGIIDQKYFEELMSQVPEDLSVILNAIIDRLRITTSNLAALGLKWEEAKRAMDAFSTKEKLD
ncbi:MAG: cyclic nucleotide-binding domain-containing protein [Nitrospinota bacterium]